MTIMFYQRINARLSMIALIEISFFPLDQMHKEHIWKIQKFSAFFSKN